MAKENKEHVTRVLPRSENRVNPDNGSCVEKDRFIWAKNSELSVKVIAWYVNPAIYILFSVLYFSLGLSL